jgi:hypothetical protein
MTVRSRRLSRDRHGRRGLVATRMHAPQSSDPMANPSSGLTLTAEDVLMAKPAASAALFAAHRLRMFMVVLLVVTVMFYVFDG